MEPDQGIQDQKTGAEGLESPEEPLPVLRKVQSQRRNGDDLQIEVPEREPTVPHESFGPIAYGAQGILSVVQDGPSGLGDGRP